MKFFVKPIVKSWQFVSYNESNNLHYQFDDVLPKIQDIERLEGNGHGYCADYAQYIEYFKKTLELRKNIVVDMLDAALRSSKRHIAVDDIVTLKPKYGNLTRGRVTGIGLLYESVSLKPVDDFCVSLVLLKKDLSDSGFSGFVTNTGFALYKPRKMVPAEGEQITQLPLLPSS